MICCIIMKPIFRGYFFVSNILHPCFRFKIVPFKGFRIESNIFLKWTPKITFQSIFNPSLPKQNKSVRLIITIPTEHELVNSGLQRFDNHLGSFSGAYRLNWIDSYLKSFLDVWVWIVLFEPFLCTLEVLNSESHSTQGTTENRNF